MIAGACSDDLWFVGMETTRHTPFYERVARLLA
jgi:hypothetical protein